MSSALTLAFQKVLVVGESWVCFPPVCIPEQSVITPQFVFAAFLKSLCVEL